MINSAVPIDKSLSLNYNNNKGENKKKGIFIMANLNMVDISGLGNIKELRESMGLTQCKVAKHCGVSLQAYYRWENGITKLIKADNFNRLCEILEVKNEEPTTV